MKTNVLACTIPLFRRLAVVATAILISATTTFGSINFKSASNAMTSSPSGNAATTLTVAKPAGISAGDFMLAQITIEKGLDVNINSFPAGWTLVRRDNSGTDIGQAVYVKVATVSDVAATAYQWGFSQAIKGSAGILAYENVNSIHPEGGPVLGSSGAAAASGTTRTIPSVNAADRSLLVAMFGLKKTDSALPQPAGMESRYFFTNPQDNRIRAADELLSGAQLGTGGATGARSSVGGVSEKWVGQMLALRANSIPVYTPPADQSAISGEETDIYLGAFVDPDLHGSWTVTVQWGDTTEETFQYSQAHYQTLEGVLSVLNHTYSSAGTYTVSVQVDDGIDSVSGSFEVSVVDPQDPKGPEEPLGIQRVAHTTGVNGGSGAATLTINSPYQAQLLEGDFLLAVITFEKGNEVDFAVANTVPAGWVLIHRAHFGSDIGQAIFAKSVTPGEPNNYTWSFQKRDKSKLQVRAGAGIILFRGANASHPIIGVNGSSGDSKNLVLPSVSTEEGAYVLGFFGIKKKTGLSIPSGMADVYFVQHSNGSGPSIRATEEISASNGTTGTRTSVAGEKEKWVGQLITLRP